MANKQITSESNYWSTERVNKLLKKIEEEGLDFKEVENPFYDGDPELKKPNLLWEYTPDEILEIEKCSRDVIYFAKYCKVMTDYGYEFIKLRDYQESVIEKYQNHRFNIMVAPRQTGKCFLPTNDIIINGLGTKIYDIDVNNNTRFLDKMKIFLYKIYVKL